MENTNQHLDTPSILDTSIDTDDKEKLLFSKLGLLFQDYLLSEMQCLAVFKYIKDVFLKKGSDDSSHVKLWILMKINKKALPQVYDKNQVGCPDLVPGLTIRSFWDPYKFDWINELLKNFNLIKEELINLREGKGFQPYKSPSYASDIKVKL